MQYKRLEKSSLLISTIGFGCMSLKQGASDNEKLIHAALDAGINFFDTADLYENGYNEEMLGNALRGKRNNTIIATKVGNQRRADGNGWDWNPSKDYILNAVENSLRRLQTDYIDLYQLHGGTMNDNIDETIEAFELLKQQGKIRYYGISSIRPAVIKEYIKKSNIASVMMQYSLLDRRPEEECLDLLYENSIGVLARGSLAQGLLSGKPAKAYLTHTEETVDIAGRAVGFVASSHGAKAATALQYIFQHPAITSAIAGIRTLAQLEDILRIFDIPEMSGAEYSYLKNAIPALHYS